MRHVFLVVVCLLQLPGATFADRPVESLEFTIVPEPEPGVLGYPQDVVIRDPIAWGQFWETLHPGVAPPEIRFPERMVVVVGLGVQGIGGPGIEVTRVTRRRAPGLTPPLVTIHITEHRPGKNCGGPAILTFPYTIIETMGSTEVTFRRTTRYVRCG